MVSLDCSQWDVLHDQVRDQQPQSDSTSGGTPWDTVASNLDRAQTWPLAAEAGSHLEVPMDKPGELQPMGLSRVRPRLRKHMHLFPTSFLWDLVYFIKHKYHTFSIKMKEGKIYISLEEPYLETLPLRGGAEWKESPLMHCAASEPPTPSSALLPITQHCVWLNRAIIGAHTKWWSSWGSFVFLNT